MSLRIILAVAAACCVFSAVAAATAADRAGLSALPGLYPRDETLPAAEIIARAHAAAGGETWARPASLFMSGYSVMYRDGAAATYDRYEMSRVYPARKGDAHKADGKVRIEAWRDGERAFVIAYDGERTYDANGPVTDQSANARWASNFGFGAIRHALDEGWSQRRLPDDLVDGRLAHVVELTDPSGGTTRFAIAADDYAILYVGFDTPRGWHERRYSEFFTRPGRSWVQPGRVRLYYDGVKQNEVIWEDFDLDVDFSDDRFRVAAP